MKPGRSYLAIPVGALTAFFLLGGCFFNRNFQYRVEVTSGSTRDEKVAIAHSLVTPESLSILRGRLKARFRGLTDAQVDGIGFGIQIWNKSSNPQPGDDARVYIAIQGLYSKGFDPQPVVLAAAEILEAELKSVRSAQPGS